ncbi:hypothetical protein N7466_000394 [Penicillium verhagenii]|uniref:uncharacterized protein n=1 Tax=Penicillium verhagenii TaxID=1562060 RepID=UPI00254580DD|nr:uncharacterized protein N7466_000394 [Penicillium verhagenii]KAJ5947379.1 hypothetical protein N7466_000394 [Penicillium verhagenii]
MVINAWYHMVGFVAVDDAIFALGQAILLWLSLRQVRRADDGERQPLLESSEYVSLKGPLKGSKTDEILFTAKITYEGVTNENHEAVCDNAKPIIIHKYGFSHDHFRLQRRRPDFNRSKDSDTDPTQWKTYVDDEQNPGYMIVDEPDVEVNVTNASLFRCLKPGEHFVSHNLLPRSDLHPDTVVGDTYRYQYWGGRVDWWVWGDHEEHASKVVKLPCWLSGKVVDPADNDGKPAILVPSSNFAEFTIVD